MKNIIVITSVVITLFSCSKKQSSASPQSTNTVNGAFVYSNIISTNIVSNVSDTAIQAYCLFYNTPINPNNGNIGNYTDAGFVSINSITLQKTFLQANRPVYNDTTNAITSFPLTIAISGSSNFGSTYFIDNGNWMPNYTNYNQLPNSISKSAGFTYSLSNLVNTAVTEVTIGNIKQSYTTNIISFSPAQLASISTSTFTSIEIKCTSTETLQSFAGNAYSCTGVFTYQKAGISITP